MQVLHFYHDGAVALEAEIADTVRRIQACERDDHHLTHEQKVCRNLTRSPGLAPQLRCYVMGIM